MNAKQTEMAWNLIYSFFKIKPDTSFVFFDFLPIPKMKEEKPINLSPVCAGEITLSTRCHLILSPQLQKELRVRSQGKAGRTGQGHRQRWPCRSKSKESASPAPVWEIKELRAKTLHMSSNLPWTLRDLSGWLGLIKVKYSFTWFTPTPSSTPRPFSSSVQFQQFSHLQYEYVQMFQVSFY